MLTIKCTSTNKIIGRDDVILYEFKYDWIIFHSLFTWYENSSANIIYIQDASALNREDNGIWMTKRILLDLLKMKSDMSVRKYFPFHVPVNAFSFLPIIRLQLN